MVRYLDARLAKRAVAAIAIGFLFTVATRAAAQERASYQTVGGGGAYRMAFSPDSALLAVAENNGDIVIWDVILGKPRHILKGHTNTVTQLTFASDGITLVAAHTIGLVKVPASVVKHWDVVTGQEKLSFVLEDGGANRALSADGRILVTVQGHPNRTAKVWDLTTRKEVVALQLDALDVRTAAVTPDGKLVALGGGAGEVKLFELPSGKPRGGFEMITGGIDWLTFSPDGRVLAAKGQLPDRPDRFSELCYFWDVTAGKKIEVGWVLKRHGGGACFAPNSKVLAFAMGPVHLWSLPGGARLARLSTRDQSATGSVVIFSPDGRLVATASSKGTIRIWDVPKLKPGASGIQPRQLLKIAAEAITCVALSPDGRTAAFTTRGREVKLWDVAQGKEVASLGGYRSGVGAVVFSPDGKTLATSALDEPARLWDVAARQVRARLEGCATGSRWVAFSSDGKIVATAEGDDAIRLWDPAGGKLLAELHGEARRLSLLGFSPDGRTLACAAEKGGVALWDMATRKVRAMLQGLTDPVVSLAWSPDGKTLATATESVRGDKGVVLWDATLGQQRRRLEVERHVMAPLSALAFSPDGQILAVAGSRGWIQLWDVGAGRWVAELEVRRSILSMAFSPDGRLLVGGSQDGTVGLWGVPAARP